MMKNIMKFEQWREMYTNYLMIRPLQGQRVFTYKDGDLYVSVTTNKRYNRQTTARD